MDAFYIATLLGNADIRTSQIYTLHRKRGTTAGMNSLAARKKRTAAKVPTLSEQRQLAAAVNY